MIVIGVTGSIGMGKSTLTSQLAALGAKVINADAIVHQLLAKGGKAVESVGKSFPGVVNNGAVERKKLGEIVFADKAKLQLLETILHPLVVVEEEAFVKNAALKGAKLAVLDIPLLFETGAQQRCSLVLVASAPAFIQKQRVMKRPHMNAQKFARIVATQMPDSEKCALADAVIQTGLGKAHSFRELKIIIGELLNA